MIKAADLARERALAQINSESSERLRAIRASLFELPMSHLQR